MREVQAAVGWQGALQNGYPNRDDFQDNHDAAAKGIELWNIRYAL